MSKATEAMQPGREYRQNKTGENCCNHFELTFYGRMIERQDYYFFKVDLF
jgi:hypothetical protein